jgi:site-specific DNA recombinase
MDIDNELQALFNSLRGNVDEPDETKLSDIKYAVYARKSTTDDERQERSISDQVRECMDFQVRPYDLKVVDIVEESFSAKTAGTRFKFSKLVQDIENGKITGLIAWHPDRLARNMKEAGEIIDLLARGILKDLRFATFTFENNPTGKMLLGISFVLSQQYSEHLSESVTRGNKRITEDGEFLGKMRQGYYIDEKRQLQPEEKQFTLLQQAFQMRLDGVSQVDIVKWLNESSFQVRRRGGDLKPYVWDKDALSKVLKDPTYAGVLKYGKHHVILSDKYNFEQMISVQDFLKLNKIDSLDSPKILSIKRDRRTSTKADFLRGLVHCAYCNKPFSSGLVKKKLKDEFVYYYYYKCETEDCVFRGRSVRAKVVVNLVKQFFHEYLFITRQNYEGYVSMAKSELASRRKHIDSVMTQAVSRLHDIKKRYEEEKDLIRDNPKLAPHYSLDERQDSIAKLEELIERQKLEKKALNEAILPFKEYLKLFENIGVILEGNNNMIQLNAIIKFFFSNFTIKQYGVGKKQGWDIDYKLKEPWEGFLQSNDFVRGRGERTRTFDLTVPNRAR